MGNLSNKKYYLCVQNTIITLIKSQIANEQTFIAKGYEYAIDQFGVINQVDPEPFTYDSNYVQTYNTPAYKKNSEILQALRLGFTLAAHGRYIGSLIDVGYGNGAFMKFSKQHVATVNGMDITGVPVPKGCGMVTEFKKCDVITFWDCLEHIPDISFLKDLPCETLVVSLPYCHYFTQGAEWMETKYLHLKFNEHLRHFNPDSLKAMMAHYGWEMQAVSTHEDIVRKTAHGLQNILTMAFKRDTHINGMLKTWGEDNGEFKDY